MPTRILHVSDLHFGARGGTQDAALGDAVADLTASLAPELVVVSGDLSHRGRPGEFAAAADFLRGLGRPLLIVPGNHDMPLEPISRLIRPWRGFERCFGTTEPVYTSDALQVVGLNSARPLRHQAGRLSGGQLARAAASLAEAAPGACRIAVLHHQLLGAPWRSRKRPLVHRSAVLSELLDAGAELVVGGHIHQVTVSAGGEFWVEAPSVVVTTAPGLARPRPRRRGEACGALAYAVDDDAIGVTTYLWSGLDLEPTASRLFGRGGARVATAPAGAVRRGVPESEPARRSDPAADATTGRPRR